VRSAIGGLRRTRHARRRFNMEVQPEGRAGEIKRLRRRINDLVGVLALPAIWTGGEPFLIVNTLLESLLGMLRLDFIYARLGDSAGDTPIELVRVAPMWEPKPEPKKIGEMIGQWLGDDSQKWPPVARNSFRDEDISIAPLRLGLQGEIGLIVAGSRRADFPELTEKLVLSVAANQAAIGLPQARLLSEQKQVAGELDKRVAQRSTQLAEANEELKEEIAERKQAEEKFRRSEADLHEAQRLTHTGSWKLDMSSGKVTVSPEIHRMFCSSPDEDTSNTEFWFGRIHPEDRQQAQKHFERCLAEKLEYEADYRLLLPDDTIRHQHAVGSPIFNESGDLVEFVGTAMDVTEQVQARTNLVKAFEAIKRLKDRLHDENLALKEEREKLRRGEADLHDAQRLSHTGSYKHDVLSGKVVSSPESLRLWGTRPDDDISSIEFYFSRMHPEDRERFRELYERCLNEKTEYEADFRIVLPDGSVRHQHSIGRPVLNESGDLVEYVGTTADVTEQVEARQNLENAFEEIKRLKDRLYGENLALKEEIDQASMFEEIVGASDALRTVLSLVSKVGPTDSTVLLTGETGTGKELIARAIHKRSQRASRAFVCVNCAAIPASLIASELFGHEKGAYTGAVERRLGRFELAEQGTVFLDEIGELPPETQIALLRVLQEREFERVGGNKAIRADVRVIAATNRDLEAAIAAGAFRSDLFYRLNVFPIEVPPLRERKEDIPLLVAYFIARFARKAGKRIQGISKKTLELLISYSWPGNIRELQNVVERSVIVCETENFSVDESWLSREPLAAQPKNVVHLSQLDAQEREMIEAALRESRGRVSGPTGAAAILGIPGTTLESKIRSLNINKNRFKTARPA